jgi:hypothetical protein
MPRGLPFRLFVRELPRQQSTSLVCDARESVAQVLLPFGDSYNQTAIWHS